MLSFGLGMLFVSVVWLITNNSYKNILLMKADEQDAEFIKGRIVRIVNESEYIILKEKARRYSQLKDSEVVGNEIKFK